jgi:hypothetical protein
MFQIRAALATLSKASEKFLEPRDHDVVQVVHNDHRLTLRVQM